MAPEDDLQYHATLMDALTLALSDATIVALYARHSWRAGSNWPLAYHAGVVLYMRYFEGVLQQRHVYAAIGTALLPRFEFMPGLVPRLMRLLESLFLLYVLWRSLGVSRDWW